MPWFLLRTFWLFACHFLWGVPVIMARLSFAAEMIHLTFSLLAQRKDSLGSVCLKITQPVGNWLSTSALDFIDTLNYCVVSWQMH